VVRVRDVADGLFVNHSGGGVESWNCWKQYGVQKMKAAGFEKEAIVAST